MRQRSGPAAIWDVRSGGHPACGFRSDVHRAPRGPPGRARGRRAGSEARTRRLPLRVRARDLPVPRARLRTRDRRGLRRRRHMAADAGRRRSAPASRPAAERPEARGPDGSLRVPRPPLHRRHGGRDPKARVRRAPPTAAPPRSGIPFASASARTSRPTSSSGLLADVLGGTEPSLGRLHRARRRQEAASRGRRGGSVGAALDLGRVDGRRRGLAAVRRARAGGRLLVSREAPERDGPARDAARARHALRHRDDDPEERASAGRDDDHTRDAPGRCAGAASGPPRPASDPRGRAVRRRRHALEGRAPSSRRTRTKTPTPPWCSRPGFPAAKRSSCGSSTKAPRSSTTPATATSPSARGPAGIRTSASSRTPRRTT